MSSLAKCKVREKTTPRQFVKNKVRETLSDLGYVISSIKSYWEIKSISQLNGIGHHTCQLSSYIIFDPIHLHYMLIEFIYYKLMKIMNIVFVFVKLVQLYLQLYIIFNIYRNTVLVSFSYKIHPRKFFCCWFILLPIFCMIMHIFPLSRSYLWQYIIIFIIFSAFKRQPACPLLTVNQASPTTSDQWRYIQ